MSDIVPFGAFLAAVAAARPEDFADELSAGALAVGLTPEAARTEFEKIKAHVLAYYADVHPVGSFRGTNGRVFDRVPFDQQPSARAARRSGHTVARSAPPPLALGTLPAPTPVPERVEADDAVAVLRLDLGELVRHGTLENWFRKTRGNE